MGFRKKNLMNLDDAIISAINGSKSSSSKPSEEHPSSEYRDAENEDGLGKQLQRGGDSPEEAFGRLIDTIQRKTADHYIAILKERDKEHDELIDEIEKYETELEEKKEEYEAKLKEKDEECEAKLKKKDSWISAYIDLILKYQDVLLKFANKDDIERLTKWSNTMNDIYPELKKARREKEKEYKSPYEEVDEPLWKYHYGWLYGGYDDWKRKHPDEC